MRIKTASNNELNLYGFAIDINLCAFYMTWSLFECDEAAGWWNSEIAGGLDPENCK